MPIDVTASPTTTRLNLAPLKMPAVADAPSATFALSINSPAQPTKAFSPMLSTLAGITTAATDVQPLKALLPILLTPSGNATTSIALQPPKALSPMRSTPAPKATLFKFV